MARNVIVLDTHALLWWALDPERLSAAARDAVDEMERHGGFASAISIWELGVKVQRGRLELPISVEEFARRIERGRVVELLPVDTSTWLRSLSLRWNHSDPADRVIVATALIRGTRVITKDQAIHAFPDITSVW